MSGARHDWTIQTWNDAAGNPREVGIIDWGGGQSTVLLHTWSFPVPVSAPVLVGGITTVYALIFVFVLLAFRKRKA